MTARTSVITDRTPEKDLPDVAPGEEAERAIASHKFIVLWRIRVRDLVLARLRIGEVEVPFELEKLSEAQGQVTDGPLRIYKPRGLDDDALKKKLISTGAAVVAQDAIAVAPALEVPGGVVDVDAHNTQIRVTLRNEGTATVKPRIALVVQEEQP